MSFVDILNESEVILTEGALVERLKSEYNLEMDEHLNHAKLIRSHPNILEMLYRQYIDIGLKYNLPIMIMTPTRKVNAASLLKSNIENKDIITESCQFLNNIKESYVDKAPNILIGGLLGCKGDAYSGQKKMEIQEAFTFHKNQTTQFKKEQVDFLFAGIMPEINEAIGMAQAMSETNIPYIISFMMTNNGCLMDGTTLTDAIKTIDEEVSPRPICYMTNCIHPTNLRIALANLKDKSQLNRFKGIQANASILSPEALNNCEMVQQEDFNTMIEEMYLLHQQYGLKILGGCCGTNDLFIAYLSKKIKLQ